jgi:hypothetical protein
MSKKSHCHIGPLSKGGPGKHKTHARIELDVPDRITNSSSRETYVGTQWQVRQGGDQHQQYKSRGV